MPTPTLAPDKLIGRPVKGAEKAVFRMMEDGRIRFIADWLTFLAIGYSANDLVTIPISDCYDPTRPEALRSAERETFAAYKRMVAAAAADSTVGLRVGPDSQLDPD